MAHRYPIDTSSALKTLIKPVYMSALGGPGTLTEPRGDYDGEVTLSTRANYNLQAKM